MVVVEKYIKRLLYEQDCVIIPDFGGLLTHYSPARYDGATGRYIPSSKRVAFNEVLKMDDGLLAQFIAVNEGMSRDAAQQCIKDFVVTASGLMKKNKVITLNGIGQFHLSEENRLQFQAEANRNFHSEFFGLSELIVRNIQQVPAIVSTPSAFTSDEQEEEYVALPPVTKKSSNWLNWMSAAMIAGLLVYVSAVLSERPNQTTSSLNPFNAITALFERSSAAVVSEEVTVTAPVEEKLETLSVPVDEVIAEPIVEEAVSEPVVEVVTPVVEEVKVNARYHVIGAVYETKSSLEKYGAMLQSAMRKQGFTDFETIRKNGKYLYSIGGYASKEEATEKLSKLKKTSASGAWVYDKR